MRRGKSSRSWGMVIGVLTLCAAASIAWGDDSQDTVARIKSAYLLNFMKFTTWPESVMPTKDSPIELVMVGDDTLGEHLDATFKGRTVQGHPVVIHRTHMPERTREQSGDEYDRQVTHWLQMLRSKHMVYVCASEDRRASVVFDALAGGPTLTIADSMEVMRRGAMLGLALEEGRVVFYADRDAIERSHVVLSSQVLRLAKLVTGEGRRN